MQIKEAVIVCIGRGINTAETLAQRMPKRLPSDIAQALARLKLQGQIISVSGCYALTDRGVSWFKRLTS